MLGTIQGLTEFFPVSSSGHLVLVPFLFGWEYIPVYIVVTLHLATVFSLVAVLYRDIWRIIKAFFTGIFVSKVRKDNQYFRISVFIIIASIPAALAGFLAGDYIERFFSKPLFVGIFLLITAALLFFGEFAGKKMEIKKNNAGKDRETGAGVFEGFSFWKIMIIGLGQAVAVLPGISRSGSTISAGRFLGLNREDCVRFSFLLSIPVIIGAFVFKIINSINQIAVFDVKAILSIVTGFIFAFASGYIAVRFLIKYSKTKNLNFFAIYCIVIAVIIFILSAIRKV